MLSLSLSNTDQAVVRSDINQPALFDLAAWAARAEKGIAASLLMHILYLSAVHTRRRESFIHHTNVCEGWLPPRAIGSFVYLCMDFSPPRQIHIYMLRGRNDFFVLILIQRQRFC